MSASLRALLSGVIDYAGLFPPAKLPLDQAIRNYARYRQEPEAWMLGRFICPAARLKELKPFLEELFPGGPPLAVSALGQGGPNSDTFVTGLKSDLLDVAAFRTRHLDRVVVDVLEIRGPTDSPGPDPQPADALLRLIAERGAGFALGPPVVAPYLEIPPGSEWRPAILAVVSALADEIARYRQLGRGFCPAGFKLRCGGLEASAFPSPEQVAFALIACRNAGVPLKFTAGLHHPIRHFDAGLQAPMHGFLNVFVAGVLAHARILSEERVRQIIEDEDASHFTFEETGLHWMDLHATTLEVISARRELVTSFGSCSFDEPREDLRALALLP